MLLIEQGMLHPMTGIAAWQGDVLVENGKILRMERRIDPTTLRVETVVDARGLHVWPGFLDAHTHLGITEDSPLRADPTDAAFAQAAAAGVTLAEVCPAPVHAGMRDCVLWQTGKAPEKMDIPGSLLLRAEEWSEAQLGHALEEAAAQNRQVRVQVCRGSEVLLIQRLLREHPVACVLEHRAQGADMGETLAACGLPVVICVSRHRGEESAYDLTAHLVRKGCRVALSTNHPTARIHHLPLCAGLCLRAGLTEEEAMAVITRDAAKAMGVKEVCGTLEEGKRANLVLLDGSPLRLATAVQATFAGGKRVYSRG